MKHRALMVAVGIMTVSILTPVVGQAQMVDKCPDPIPDQPTLSEIAACLQRAQVSSVPSGAVMAFDLPGGCPVGWADVGEHKDYRQRFAGRTLIVSGPRVDRGAGTTKVKPFDKQGGQEAVALALEEMPKHTHEVAPRSGPTTRAKPSNFGAAFDKNANFSSGNQTGARGKGLSHDNMPPYIALYFCKKI